MLRNLQWILVLTVAFGYYINKDNIKISVNLGSVKHSVESVGGFIYEKVIKVNYHKNY